MTTILAGALDIARAMLLGRGDPARMEVHDDRTTDISTVGDRIVSRALVDYFGNSGISGVLVSEELGTVPLCSNPNYTIAIDDIDGTDNFFRGEGLLPYCTVVTILEGTDPTFSRSLCAGVVEHRSGRVWLAERGKGCTVDGTQVSCSMRQKVDRRTLVVIDHYACACELWRFSKLHSASWIKDFGSAGFHLAGVASGMFDAFVSSGQKGHELASGYLMIKEGGGSVLDFQGKPIDDILFDFNAKYHIVASGNLTLAQEIVSRIERIADSETPRTL